MKYILLPLFALLFSSLLLSHAVHAASEDIPPPQTLQTMPYASDDLMVTRLTETRLTELTDDERLGEIDWVIVDRARAEADELVEGYCRGRYHVPFTDPAPGIVASAAADITAYKLYQRRMGTDMPESIVKAHTNALKVLESIQKGHIQLGAAVAADGQPGQATIASNSAPEDKQFPKSRWQRLP